MMPVPISPTRYGRLPPLSPLVPGVVDALITLSLSRALRPRLMVDIQRIDLIDAAFGRQV